MWVEVAPQQMVIVGELTSTPQNSTVSAPSGETLTLYVEITPALYSNLTQWLGDGPGRNSTGATTFAALNLADLAYEVRPGHAFERLPAALPILHAGPAPVKRLHCDQAPQSMMLQQGMLAVSLPAWSGPGQRPCCATHGLHSAESGTARLALTLLCWSSGL